jgi:hypothetical protein
MISRLSVGLVRVQACFCSLVSRNVVVLRTSIRLGCASVRAHLAHVAPGRGETARSSQDGVSRNGLAVLARNDLAKHWGETGGTPADKDGEIRVRMGKFTNQP